MASTKPAGVSSKLMGLKFMQRAQAKEDLSKHKEKQVKAKKEEEFVLESKAKAKGCIVLEDDFVMQSSGRISFMNYNPEIDALNKEHQARIKQCEVDEAERDDVSATEMAQVLRKRKLLSDASPVPAEQSPEGYRNPSQPSATKSPKTSYQQSKEGTKARKSRCDAQLRGGTGKDGCDEDAKSPDRKCSEGHGRRKTSGRRGCEPTSLRAAAVL